MTNAWKLGGAALALALCLAACHHPGPDSPEYEQAFKLYTQLYSAKLDDAYGDSRMQMVLDSLRKVDPASSRAAEAKDLQTKVEQGLADYQKRQETVAAEERAAEAPAKWTGDTDRSAPPAPPAPAAGAPGPALGMSRDDFLAKFGNCFELKGLYQQGNSQGEAYSVKADCAQRYSAFTGSLVVILEGKVSRQISMSDVQKLDKPPPAPAPPAPPPPAAPPPPPPQKVRWLPGAPHPASRRSDPRPVTRPNDGVGLKDRALLAALRAVPRHALSRAVGEAASWSRPGPLARLAVRGFARRYRLDLSEAERSLSDYRTVRELFTRRLRPGVRPVAPGDGVPVSPADGVVYQAGVAAAGKLVQAKGIDYTLAELLADGRDGAAFQGGAYVAIYLSPHDYHRVHAPLGGRITGYAYVPGELWPVNPASVATVPRLFARNERLVMQLATPMGRCAVVMVGATVVGLLRASFDAEATADRRARRTAYATPRPIEKGAELGVFDMGSTVICCFEPGRVALDPGLVPGAAVRVGGALGHG